MNIEELLVDLGAPRELSAAARARLERRLIEGDVGDDAPAIGALPRIDAPRPLSPSSRRRLESALLLQRRRPAWAPHQVVALATAAAVLAAALVLVRSPSPTLGPPERPTGRSALGERPSPTPGTGGGSVTVADGFENPSRSRARIGGPFPGGGASPLGPLTVAMHGGDPDQEAGFQAYVAQLNASGGVHGRRVDLVQPSTAHVVATVNLSGSALLPSDLGDGPLLETLEAPEDILRDNVFSFASPPERQARLLVASVFPTDDASAVAAVYRGTSGVFADEVPRALREALEGRGVRVIELEYEPGGPVPFVPADAVFLSLDQSATLAFLDQAREQGYTYSGTVACFFPMLDTDVVGGLAEGYLVLSPYSLGPPHESSLIEDLTGRGLSAGTIHGWVTAKALSTAIARTGAGTADEVLSALRGLDGYEHGFAPAYATRPGTNVRVPDGILYEVRRGDYAAVGGFRTAPS